ncbi:B12-binding domain-containing radical SAM protein [Methanobacterium ferruginis]|uniref:B12-binding domain-containing radical SAM protein n=1 Tax=Methanobacterium ferruginis TaxID=710191 RepID=UPI002572BEE4|nr:radical SAM protein [Methanobacterium ferruginis]BDZ69008.1 B12-binding domain-containing radical SAM protein [Methanobacterium ferruginis]
MSHELNVLLISPPWYRIFGESSTVSPLGLCYIAGVLDANGYDVSIHDADFNKKSPVISTLGLTSNYGKYLNCLKDLNHPIWMDLANVISKKSPDIVGITVPTAKYGSALNVSRIVKNYDPTVPVIWGGPHPTILPEQVLQNKEIDIVVKGEGEYVFLDIMENLTKLEKVRGILYKNRDKIVQNQDRPLIADLDKLPFPAKHLIIEKDDYAPEVFGNIFATRGCPYNCIYCASEKLWTKKVRYRTPKNVIEEIKETKNKFNTSYFRFEDDSFSLNKKFVYGLCDLFKKEKLGVHWKAETRANLVSTDMIKEMKLAGCEEVTIGVESGNKETLERIKKGITIKQVLNANNFLKHNKMKFSAFFMVGFPWETKEDVNKTVSLMEKLDPHNAALSIPTPYPGTELYEIYISRGLIPEDIDWSTFFHQSPEMFRMKGVTREESLETIKEIELIFAKHNESKLKGLFFSDPLYLIRRMIKGKYYQPEIFFSLINKMR